IEIRVTIGSAVVCASTPGFVTLPAPVTTPGNVLAAYVDPPEPDDAVAALLEDSTGATWVTLHVASIPTAGGACPRFPDAPRWILELREPLLLPPGTPIRFLRPLRLALYHASDNRWYLGARDWNGTS